MATTKFEPFDEPGEIMREALAALKKSGLTLEQACDVTGLPFYWLRKFRAGEIQNPSVNRVNWLLSKLQNYSPDA